MRRAVAEKYRDIGFSRARRGASVKAKPGRTTISIGLDNAAIEFFRAAVYSAETGNYETLINDALRAHIHGQSTLDAVRQIVREEFVPCAEVSKTLTQRARSARH